jgi:hypothetical protein
MGNAQRGSRDLRNTTTNPSLPSSIIKKYGGNLVIGDSILDTATKMRIIMTSQ